MTEQKTLEQRLNELVDSMAAEIKTLKAAQTGGAGAAEGGEIIWLNKDKWVSNGYPYTKVINFAKAYKNPVVIPIVNFAALSTQPISIGVGPVTATGCTVRLQGGLTYADIDSRAKVYVLVKEGG